MCWQAELRTLRAAATADLPGAVGCSALLIASGSSRGMRYTKLDRAVNVDLPQPFAPAMIVSRGGSPSIRVRFFGGLLTRAFSKDLLQTLAVDRKLRPRIFCHLLCDCEPVYGHETRILRRHPFAKNAIRMGPADDSGEIVWRSLRVEEAVIHLGNRLRTSSAEMVRPACASRTPSSMAQRVSSSS